MPNGQGPNDLEIFIERLEIFIERLRREFHGSNLRGMKLVLIGLIILILLWSSWYTVPPEATAVVQRFGRVTRTAGPGLNFKIPFGVERVQLVQTARVLKEEFGFRGLAPGQRSQREGEDFSIESLMLTGDLNVIDVRWIVQYLVEDPVQFLFKLRDQRQTLRDIAESAMRRVVGNRLGSDVLTLGRVAVASEVKEEMQKSLSAYETGIRLLAVELQDVTPPDPVKPAFNEVNEARQDMERMVNQAQEQANKVIPKASGEAKQVIAEAEGYSTERVNQAQGEATRFQAVLAEYQKVPDVTRRRLYLEAASKVLSEAKGVYIVDSDQKALVPWLALDSGGVPPPLKEGKKQ